jgi:putative FmdB family regulatory protein
VGRGILSDVAAYEYVCMGCEHRFEERRPMTAPVDTALACPNCGGERVRRRYSFVAGTSPGTEAAASGSAGGCGCGTCTCGGG